MDMDERDRLKIREVKSAVIDMLEERKSLSGTCLSLFSPSKYWSDFCSFFDYMFTLPEECFGKLRLHTYHITGDNYQRYYFGDIDEFMSANDLIKLTKDIPNGYIINEPESGIGFTYAGKRFVSRDSIGCQKIINNLYRYNVLGELGVGGKEKCLILEIGAGYGALAHHLSKIIGNCTYVIIDLPETLIFSGAYLSLLNAQKNIYLYRRENYQKILRSKEIMAYDFVLLPNYILHSLEDLQFALVISIASLQEMREDQVETYVNFIARNCKGLFYSSNRDRQPRNNELSNLSVLLREKFEVKEVTEKAEEIEKAKLSPRKLALKLKKYLGCSNNIKRCSEGYSDFPYRECICKPNRSNL